MRTHHLIIDFQSTPSRLGDVQLVENFLLSCCRAVHMELLAGPYTIDLTWMSANPGVTSFIVISTSHISIHTFTQQGWAFLDLFSCVEFETQPIEDLVHKVFAPTYARRQEVAREVLPEGGKNG